MRCHQQTAGTPPTLQIAGRDDALTRSVRGVRVYLVGFNEEAFGDLSESLSTYGIETRSFVDIPAAATALRPHVLVYAIRTGDTEIGSLRLRFPTSRLFLVSEALPDEPLLRAWNLGIQGWVLPSEPPATVVSAILLICRGGIALSETVFEAILLAAKNSGRLEWTIARRRGLTVRQLEILSMVAQEMSDKEIATSLTLSVRTVHRHVQDILRKLEAHSRREAVNLMVGMSPDLLARSPALRRT